MFSLLCSIGCASAADRLFRIAGNSVLEEHRLVSKHLFTHQYILDFVKAAHRQSGAQKFIKKM
ncbi:MAG: hypothetical protein ABIZ80_17755, partial [Bryobacteraceae bacterium]